MLNEFEQVVKEEFRFLVEDLGYSEPIVTATRVLQIQYSNGEDLISIASDGALPAVAVSSSTGESAPRLVENLIRGYQGDDYQLRYPVHIEYWKTGWPNSVWFKYSNSQELSREFLGYIGTQARFLRENYTAIMNGQIESVSPSQSESEESVSQHRFLANWVLPVSFILLVVLFFMSSASWMKILIAMVSGFILWRSVSARLDAKETKERMAIIEKHRTP